jgi:ADP-ribose pyrophosphatase YjhB (NUDIX family)
LIDTELNQLHDDLLVIALVPLPLDAGGDGELLALRSDGGNWAMPSAPLQHGERILAAAQRIAREAAGLTVRPERLVYFLEDECGLAWVVLCAADLDDELSEVAGLAAFVDPRELTGILEPDALRELLIEDLAAGFMRPVAHVSVDRRQTPAVAVSW